MQLSSVLDRIDQRRNELGLTEQALSIKSGCSKDLIRNWRRKVAAGDHRSGANMGSLEAIASALDVPVQWLLTGGDLPSHKPTTAQEDQLDLRVVDGRVIVAANVGAEGLTRLRAHLDALSILLEHR